MRVHETNIYSSRDGKYLTNPRQNNGYYYLTTDTPQEVSKTYASRILLMMVFIFFQEKSKTYYSASQKFLAIPNPRSEPLGLCHPKNSKSEYTYAFNVTDC